MVTEGYAYLSICMIVWIGWVRLPNIVVVIGADEYAYPGPKVLAGLLSNHEERELVNGLVEVEGVEDLGEENIGNVLVNGNRVGCSYKEFLACNPKGYDGKGEFFPSHEMQNLETELWNHAMVRVVHAAYTDRFHELARLVPHLVTLKSRKIERYVYSLAPQICEMVEATKPKTIQKVVQISGALTDEAVKNKSIKNVEKRGNVEKPSKDKNGRDNNKRTRTGSAFASIANPVGRENTEEARQDPNIMTGTFTLNKHFAATLFDSGARLKVIKGYKLEIEGHVFDIDLLSFGHGIFDVIIGMDWLSNHKAEIICHKKVVRIPLLDGKVLRVLGMKLEEKMRQLTDTD
nr:reverse transcriptase domain-containing protein [Tanacetum cinerariifolium]